MEQTVNSTSTVLDEYSDSQLGQQYLTFTLDDELYAVEILRVQEIKGWESATTIPNTPDYIRGVMNLRGTIVPVMDLRLKFGMEAVDYTGTTVVVVLKVHVLDQERIMGVIVDGVSDVFNLRDRALQPPPEFGSSTVNTGYLHGLATVNDNMVIILDVDALMSADETGSTGEVQ